MDYKRLSQRCPLINKYVIGVDSFEEHTFLQVAAETAKFLPLKHTNKKCFRYKGVDIFPFFISTLRTVDHVGLKRHHTIPRQVWKLHLLMEIMCIDLKLQINCIMSEG